MTRAMLRGWRRPARLRARTCVRGPLPLTALPTALLLAVLGLAGCGEPGGEGAGGAATRATADAAEPSAACDRREIRHRYGSTEMMGVPDRIVSLSYRDQDALFALGTAPVAVQAGFYEVPYLEWPWVSERLSGERPHVLAAGEVNFEEVAALRPDVVLGYASGLGASEHRILSRVAPTVGPSAEHVDFGVPWQESLRATGRVVCRVDVAEQRIEALEDRLAAVREQHPALTGSTAVVAMSGGPGGAYWAFGPDDSRSRFLESLGLRVPDSIDRLAGDRFVATVSAERLDLLDVDVLVWIASPEQRAALESDPLYRRLDAVRGGRVLYLEPEGLLTAAMTNTSALSLPYLLEELAPRIAAAASAARGSG